VLPQDAAALRADTRAARANLRELVSRCKYSAAELKGSVQCASHASRKAVHAFLDEVSQRGLALVPSHVLEALAAELELVCSETREVRQILVDHSSHVSLRRTQASTEISRGNDTKVHPTCEKRPANETCFYEKRPINEPCLYEKGPMKGTYLYEKRPTNETYLYAKRSIKRAYLYEKRHVNSQYPDPVPVSVFDFVAISQRH